MAFTPIQLGSETSLRPGVILYRYVARELLPPICLTLGAFTLVVLTKDFTGYIDLVINRGAGLARVSGVVFFKALPLMTQVLPFAVLVGGLVGLGRLAADLEVMVLSALGFDSRRLVAPVALLGSCLALVGLLMSLQVSPWAQRELNRSLREIAVINPAAEIQAGVVNRFGDWKLEAREVSSSGQALRRVLLWMPSVAETIFAETARVSPRAGGGMEILLQNGALLLDTRGSPRAMHFDEMRTSLPHSQVFADSAFEDALAAMNLSELSQMARDSESPEQAMDARSELHRRFVLPSAAVLFGVLALPLALARAKATRSGGAVAGLLITVAYYGLVQLAAGVAERAPDQVGLASWIPNGALLVLTVFLYRRLGKPWIRLRRSASPEKEQPVLSRSSTAPHRRPHAKRWALSRYVAARFVWLSLLCFSALVVAYLLVDILERLQWFARHAATVEEIGWFYSARIPLLVSRVTPMGLVVAMALTVSYLTSSGELVGMRCCGISARRALRPALLVCLFVTPLSFLLNDQIVPRTNELADLIKQRDIKGLGFERTAVWGTNGDSLYELDSLDTNLGTADEIVVYQLVSSGLPESRIDARSARYAGNGQWRLRDAVAVELDSEGHVFPVTPPRYVELGEQPSDELDLMYLSIHDLWRLIRELASTGDSTIALEVDLYLKLATPLACLLLPAIAMIFAVSGPPFPSSALTLIVAAIVAVTYTLAAGAFASLGRGEALAPWAAGWGPSLIAIAVLIGLSWRSRSTRRGY
jgi:lipopolysaccharide export system permease protein